MITSKNEWGKVVNGILEHVLNLYNIFEIDRLNEIEEGLHTALSIANSHSLREYEKVVATLEWINADLYTKGYHYNVLEL